MSRGVGVLFALFVICFYQGCHATTYYVSASAGSSGTGTLSNPWNSIQTAHDNMVPGDTVYVMGGTYTNYAFDYSFVAIYTSGTPGNYITYSAYPGTRPKIISPCYNAFGLYGASYIVITGFELAGNAGGINGAGQPDGNGIATQENSHHVNITNNVIYSFGGGGIGIVHSDYLNITGNTVYNCSRLSGYQTSGISCWQNFNFDNSQGKYRNIIKNNFVYNNNNTVAPGAGQSVTDGNCIIFDDSRNTQAGSTQGVYTGYTLIENNLCFGNGGRGLHVFSSDNVDVFNNVAYMNNQNPQLAQEGELTAFYASNVRFFNNIVYTHASGTANAVYSSTY